MIKAKFCLSHCKNSYAIRFYTSVWNMEYMDLDLHPCRLYSTAASSMDIDKREARSMATTRLRVTSVGIE